MITLLSTSFLAGLLSVLSPCVLPLAPVLLLSAWQQHRFGPIALVAGLSLTFSTLGLILSITGNVIGLDGEQLRFFLSFVLMVLGLALVFEAIEQGWIKLVTPLARRFQTIGDHLSITGWPGQFILGMVLGGAWLPCIGPTLGLAITLASQQQAFLKAALIMITYCVGVSTPLIALSYLVRHTLGGRHRKWSFWAKAGKRGLGVVLILIGALMASGWISSLEQWILQISPTWLIRLTSRY